VKILKLITATLLLALASSANAALELRVTDGTTSVSMSDTDGDGSLVFIGGIGNWSFNVIVGASSPLTGTGQYADVFELTSFNVTGGGPGSLQIMLSDTGFGRVNSSYNAFIGGTTSGTTAFQTYLGASNTTFDTGIQLASFGSFGPGSYSDSSFGYIDSDLLGGSDPYSLTQVATITQANQYGTTGFSQKIIIPEPAALALLGIGLLGLGIFGRRSRTS